MYVHMPNAYMPWPGRKILAQSQHACLFIVAKGLANVDSKVFCFTLSSSGIFPGGAGFSLAAPSG